MSMRTSLDSGLLSNASTGFYQDIAEFLAKPYPLYNGTFSGTDNSGTFPLTDCLTNFFTHPIYSNKVSGFLGIRATFVLRLQVNAERFQQGRYLLCFAPLMTNSASGYPGSLPRLTQVRATPTNVTQLPKVELDLNCDTEAILEIPYVSPYSHYNLLTGVGDHGC